MFDNPKTQRKSLPTELQLPIVKKPSLPYKVYFEKEYYLKPCSERTYPYGFYLPYYFFSTYQLKVHPSLMALTINALGFKASSYNPSAPELVPEPESPQAYTTSDVSFYSAIGDGDEPHFIALDDPESLFDVLCETFAQLMEASGTAYVIGIALF
jgi:hypothetical protein